MEILSKVDPAIAAAAFPQIIKEESYILITAKKPSKEALTFTVRFGGELFVTKTGDANSARMAELLGQVQKFILQS